MLVSIVTLLATTATTVFAVPIVSAAEGQSPKVLTKYVKTLYPTMRRILTTSVSRAVEFHPEAIIPVKMCLDAHFQGACVNVDSINGHCGETYASDPKQLAMSTNFSNKTHSVLISSTNSTTRCLLSRPTDVPAPSSSNSRVLEIEFQIIFSKLQNIIRKKKEKNYWLRPSLFSSQMQCLIHILTYCL